MIDDNIILPNIIGASTFFEAIKFGALYIMKMCKAPVWLDRTLARTEGSYVRSAETCTLERDSYVCIWNLGIICLISYLINLKQKSGEQINGAVQAPSRDRNNSIHA